MKMDIIDFNECSENYKVYGGMAGSKLGIKYVTEDWLLKFPKSTKRMDVNKFSYMTSPLSEYLGSISIKRLAMMYMRLYWEFVTINSL